ncbi:GNAT family N-acetyltransferase [Micromonospora aurantiaca (nom. illeg.)]|uniref:GNAT family N-acetyltransferase n=1 Tax=Micromonospora aurantiaca (nom. illeg.) TaxID=47850 RepID=UPI0035ADDE8C
MPTIRTDLTVRSARAAELPQIVSVMAAAFSTGTVAEWAVPEPADRLAVFTGYMGLMLDLGMRYGWVDVTDDLSGAAIWYRRDDTPPRVPDHVYGLQEATGRYASRFLLLDAMFEARHPQVPHWHLAYIGVNPQRQSQGIGSVLLAYAHESLDRENLPAYLEASDPRNRDLYARHGYKAETPMMPAPAGPPFWPMWRGQLHGGARSPFPQVSALHRRSL